MTYNFRETRAIRRSIETSTTILISTKYTFDKTKQTDEQTHRQMDIQTMNSLVINIVS